MQTAREVLDRAFCRRVGEQPRVGLVRIDGRGIDDRPAFLHMPDGCARHPEHGADVGVERVVPFFIADIVQRVVRHLVRGVVDVAARSWR